MERRTFLTTLVAVPALSLLAACGSDASRDSLQTSDTTAEAPVETSADTSTEPVAAPPVTDVIAAPSSDEPVLSYTTPGGFMTREFVFQDPPIALLTHDGTLIGSPVSPAVFPGPLLQRHEAQTVSPAGIEALLSAADAAGLFADVDYTSDDGLLIADASTSVLTITAAGTTYTHEAYALGIGGTESTPERQALLDFLTALQTDPASIMGAENLGASSAYEPTAYQLIATPVDDLSGFDPAPTVDSWPPESGIELAAATECVESDRSVVGDVLGTATQLTFFSENDVVYQVTARPAYPGRSC